MKCYHCEIEKSKHEARMKATENWNKIFYGDWLDNPADDIALAQSTAMLESWKDRDNRRYLK